MGERKKITALRALYWLTLLANREPGQIHRFDLDRLRDDFRSHVESELAQKKRRRISHG